MNRAARHLLPHSLSPNVLTRRRFLGGLGAGAATLAFPPRLRASDEPRPVFVATELNHLSLDITRFARSEEFYQAVFGLTPVAHGGRGGDKFMHFQQGFLNMRPADRAGMNHFCFSIRDYDPNYTYQMLEIAETRPFRMGGRNLHCYDPDGLNVQVQEERHGWGRIDPSQLSNADKGHFKTVRIHHIELNVTDVDQSRRFYKEMFGLKVLEGQDSAQSCLMSVGDNAYLILQKAEEAGMDHYCYAIDGFDAGEVADQLAKWSESDVQITESGAARITDPQGIAVELAAPDHKPSLST